jgi:putative hydrolase of the HAD superfamily
MLRPYLQAGFPWQEPEKPHLHLNDPEDWWRHLRNLLSTAMTNAGFPESAVTSSVSHVRERFLEPSRWLVYDDTIPALTAVRSLGARSIILSNHVPELEWLADRLGIRACVDSVITSGLVGYEKPHARIYEIALETTGHPERVCMVGDNPIADVAGPEAAGIPGILISRDGSRTAERVVSSLLDVPQFLSH